MAEEKPPETNATPASSSSSPQPSETPPDAGAKPSTSSSDSSGSKPGTPASSTSAEEAASATKEFSLESGKELARGAGRQAKAAAAAVKSYFSRKESLWTQLPEMVTSLYSYDRPTRRVALLFFASLTCLILVVSTVVHRYWEAKKAMLIAEAQRRAKRIEAAIRQEAEEIKRRGSLITLGSFTLELKDLSPTQKLGVGEVNMAEVEIVLLCDGHETRDYIEQNAVQVRNQLTNVMTAMDREEILSREGKRRLKTLIIRKLNEWLPHGRVEDVYFSKLLMS